MLNTTQTQSKIAQQPSSEWEFSLMSTKNNEITFPLKSTEINKLFSLFNRAKKQKRMKESKIHQRQSKNIHKRFRNTSLSSTEYHSKISNVEKICTNRYKRPFMDTVFDVPSTLQSVFENTQQTYEPKISFFDVSGNSKGVLSTSQSILVKSNYDEDEIETDSEHFPNLSTKGTKNSELIDCVVVASDKNRFMNDIDVLYDGFDVLPEVLEYLPLGDEYGLSLKQIEKSIQSENKGDLKNIGSQNNLSQSSHETNIDRITLDSKTPNKKHIEVIDISLTESSRPSTTNDDKNTASEKGVISVLQSSTPCESSSSYPLLKRRRCKKISSNKKVLRRFKFKKKASRKIVRMPFEMPFHCFDADYVSDKTGSLSWSEVQRRKQIRAEIQRKTWKYLIDNEICSRKNENGVQAKMYESSVTIFNKLQLLPLLQTNTPIQGAFPSNTAPMFDSIGNVILPIPPPPAPSSQTLPVPPPPAEIALPTHKVLFKNLVKSLLNDSFNIKPMELLTECYRRCASESAEKAKYRQQQSFDCDVSVREVCRRMTNEVKGWQRRSDREYEEQRRKKSRDKTEMRRKAEEEREALRQEKRLDFLLRQTEIYSHFMGAKMGLNESSEPSTKALENQFQLPGNKDTSLAVPEGFIGPPEILPLQETDETKSSSKVNKKRKLGEGNNVKEGSVEKMSEFTEERAQQAAARYMHDRRMEAAAFQKQMQVPSIKPTTISKPSLPVLPYSQNTFKPLPNIPPPPNTHKPSELVDSIDLLNPSTMPQHSLFIREPKLFKGCLKSYQIKGLNWLVNLYEQCINGILADEMGLGKTIQSIAFIAHLCETKNLQGPYLIIAPNGVVHNWCDEISQFCPELSVLPYQGAQKDREILRKFQKPRTYSNTATQSTDFHVLVTSYSVFQTDEKHFLKMKQQYLILDEAQAIKNSQSQRQRSLLKLPCRNRLLLTGTPIQNSMGELQSLLHFIMPSLFDRHDEFSEQFSKDIESHAEGRVAKLNQMQLKRLHMILKPFMLRRVKSDVEHELPPKQEIILKCYLTKRQRELYQAVKDKMRFNMIMDTNSKELMNLVMQFRKVCNHPEIFKRRETRSPYQFNQDASLLYHTTQTKPSITDTLKLKLKPKPSYTQSSLTYSQLVLHEDPPCIRLSDNSNPIVYRCPRILWHINHCNDGNFTETTALKQLRSSKNALEMFDLFDVLKIRSAFNEESDFLSVAKLCDQSPSELAYYIHTNFIRRCFVLEHFKHRRLSRYKQHLAFASSNEPPLLNILTVNDTLTHSRYSNDLLFASSSRYLLTHLLESSSSCVFNNVYLPACQASHINFDVSSSRSSPEIFSSPDHDELGKFLLGIEYQGDIFERGQMRLSSSRSLSSQSKECPISLGQSLGYKDIAQVIAYRRQQFDYNSQRSIQPYNWIYPVLGSNTSQIIVPEFSALLRDSGKMMILDRLLNELKKSGHRVLIFSQMTKMINILEDYCHYRKYKYFRMDGSTQLSDRKTMVKDFQSNRDIFIFLLSTRAGGLGINLTSADTVIFYDNDQNPTMDAQAMDRVHRIGQTRPVRIYRMVCQDTIEDRIQKRAQQKFVIQKSVYAGGFKLQREKASRTKDNMNFIEGKKEEDESGLGVKMRSDVTSNIADSEIFQSNELKQFLLEDSNQ